jgi:tripartite-type tricarboxylate transporter receptor subunit TctC
VIVAGKVRSGRGRCSAPQALADRAPDVSTVAEAGLKALEVEVLCIMMVPAATPEPVLAVLHQALTEALQQPDVKARP